MPKDLEQRIKDLEYFRDWIHSHPEKVDQEVRPAAIDWLNGEIADLRRQQPMKVAV